MESAVVSVGSIHGGSAFNILPPTVELRGTIRTFKPEVRALVLKRFREVATGVARSLGCEVDIKLFDVTPAVTNAPELTKRAQDVVTRLFPDCTLDTHAVTMGSEDMAFMMEDIPGCFILVGSANPERGLEAKHHHPCFDIDEAALINSAALIATVAAEILSR